MLLWIAIVMLCDASFALWHEDRVASLVPRINVRWYALIEGTLALLLIGYHFWRAG
jgi:hypothetical protein